MKCLRSGYCCIQHDVMILLEPDKGMVESNIAHKPAGEICPHLIGQNPGTYSCKIHDHSIFKKTPCHEFTQIEDGDTNCRLGEQVLKKL